MGANRAFWDRPRVFLASESDHAVLFECPFDEALDEYLDVYRVYRMPALDSLALEGSWQGLQTQALGFLGEIPVRSVKFDPTFRRQVDLEVLATLGPGT